MEHTMTLIDYVAAGFTLYGVLGIIAICIVSFRQHLYCVKHD